MSTDRRPQPPWKGKLAVTTRWSGADFCNYDVLTDEAGRVIQLDYLAEFINDATDLRRTLAARLRDHIHNLGTRTQEIEWLSSFADELDPPTKD